MITAFQYNGFRPRLLIVLFLQITLFSLCSLVFAAEKVKAQPYDLRCEYLTDPLGIDTMIPRFSWKQVDPDHVRGQKQSAYRLLASSSRELLSKDRGDLWDSGKVSSAQSTLVPYGGVKLASNQDCYWKVQVYDRDGEASNWSAPARFSMGLLQNSDWQGPWIKHPDAPVEKHIWFRKNLKIDEPLTSAFIHVASVGYHELYVNGERIADHVLRPAATRLDKRVLYMTYDIKPLLKPGRNTIALWQGPGWGRYRYFKTMPALRVQMNATTSTGKTITQATDNTWRCLVSSSENIGGTKYGDNGGERIDARGYMADWNAVGFDDSLWQLAVVAPISATLSAQMMEPTRIIETIPAQSISGDGPVYKVDMGKNFTGWLQIKVRGLSVGDVVTCKVADDDMTVQDFGQKNEFISSGKDGEAFQNRFNYIAGRFITLEGLKSKPNPADITGYALSTDLKRSGKFSSSNELFNQIYEADLWTWRTNLVEGFTMDCPHRERLGYGEVAFACAWGIAFPNYQSEALYTKHVRDWSDVQEKNGWIHHTAPQINKHYGGPIWSSAGQNIAQDFYQNFGDQRILELAHPTSKRWLEYLHSHVKDGLLRSYTKQWGKFLGDWAAPGNRKERGGSPEAEFFNNCVYAMNLKDFIESSRILNMPDEVALYSARLEALRKQVHAAYFLPEKKTYCNGTQVQLAFALLAGITPPELRSAVISSLDQELTQKSYLDMGSSGLPILLKYLIESSDQSARLYQHLSSTEEPSYGYFLKRGENTWPEYWNVDVPSRIHTCYTGISAWFTKSVAGIRPDPENPGFQSFLIKPVLGGDLTFADFTTESPYGTIRNRWERSGDRFKMFVTVPPNSQATVFVPISTPSSLTEGGKPIAKVKDITQLETREGYIVLRVPAGRYAFSCLLK